MMEDKMFERGDGKESTRGHVDRNGFYFFIKN